MHRAKTQIEFSVLSLAATGTAVRLILSWLQIQHFQIFRVTLDFYQLSFQLKKKKS